MPNEVRVRIVEDEYGVYSGDGFQVDSTETEHRAFSLIENAIRKYSDETRPAVLEIVLGKRFRRHFDTYRLMKHVVVNRLSPRTELAKKLTTELPDWLSNEDILRWNLLSRPIPKVLLQAWPDLLVEWFMPGSVTALHLVDLLRAAVDAVDSHDVFSADPLRGCLIQRFQELCTSLPSSFQEPLRRRLDRAERPDSELRQWVEHTWYLPVVKNPGSNPLLDRAAPEETKRFAELAKQLPLVFPLPTNLARQITPRVANSIMLARVSDARDLSRAAKSLTFITTDIAKAIATWIENHPSELTTDASQHLASLPGFRDHPRLRSLIDECSPVRMTDAWRGLDENFPVWVRAYAKYVRSTFNRRSFSQWNEDPAYLFAKWLKANHEVIFTHRERSYARVATTVRQWLSRGRPVLLILIDALAIHLSDRLNSVISGELEETASMATYLFSPAPTITEQCKRSVLSGKLPRDTGGDLKSQLAEVYGLNPSQILLATHWRDAESSSPVAATKLLLYLDNRLDQTLSVASHYRDLNKSALGIFRNIAQLCYRWVQDLRILHSNDPVVLVTADHGFTYGPPPTSDHFGDQQRKPPKRCIRVGSETAAADLPESRYTILSAEKFGLDSPYVAVRDRAADHEVSNHWVLSHGGLLPEEIIIPLMEWYGAREVQVWPELSILGPAVRREEAWTLKICLTNHTESRVVSGTLSARTMLSQPLQTVEYLQLDPGQERSIELRFGLPDALSDQSVLDVEFELLPSRRPETGAKSRTERRTVELEHPLIHRTKGQEEFEAMF